MIEKALPVLFKAVTDEAAANAAFAARLEGALGKFAEDYVAARATESQVEGFHPFIEFKKDTPEAFRARLSKFDLKALRLLVKNHNLDPAAELGGKGAKKALVDFIAAAAQKRAERDAKLFEY